MRILHTADWHVGKRLGRYDRMDEYREVLDEIVGIAETEAVDLVLVAGDLFDRPIPPVEALTVALDALERLAAGGRTVVAIAGNHDSPELFEVLGRLLRHRRIFLVGQIHPAERGGVLEIAGGGERALVACMPFLREGQAIDLLADADAWPGQYAQRLAEICASYNRFLEERATPDTVTVLLAHFLMSGVRLNLGAPRGERPLHMSQAYAANAQSIPSGVGYVALGHVHAPQPAPGAVAPAAYAGSILELDFGEAGEAKRVVIVDAVPGRRATQRAVGLRGGRRLLRAAGRFEELVGRAELQQGYLDLTIRTDGPDPGLADRARQAFPLLVRVAADHPRAAPPAAPRRDLPWDGLYREYFRKTHGAEASEELVAAFREIHDEVSRAAT
jgi:exonuclease SbcD